MAKFVVFFKFTSQSVKAMIDHPSDRAAIVAQLCESAGARMEGYYLMFGAWDGMVLVEGPDSKAAAAVSLAVTSSGGFAALETHELIEPGELSGILATAGSLRYTPPSGE